MSRIDEAMERSEGGGRVQQTDARQAATPGSQSVPAAPTFAPEETATPADDRAFAHDAPAPDTFALEEPLSRELPEPPATAARPAQAPTGHGHQAWIERLVTHPDASPSMIDQFRKLAAALHHAQLERATRVALVSSAVGSEGKTLTALNLALTLCESYDRRVLLVDADLRRPRLHGIFGRPQAPGLTDVVAGTNGRQLPATAITPRLSLLTAGSPRHDPINTLSTDRMQRLLMEASSAYDWVVLDTSPVGMLPDAHLLSAIVDCVVLVVRSGAAPYPLVQRAAEAIGPDRIIGVVLNGVAAGQFTAAYPDQGYYQAQTE